MLVVVEDEKWKMRWTRSKNNKNEEEGKQKKCGGGGGIWRHCTRNRVEMKVET